MDINLLKELIGSFGFPIIACGACFWKINDQDKKHKEEVNNLTEVLEKNTVAITKLSDALQLLSEK